MRGEERRGGGVNEIFLRLLNYQRTLSYLAWPAHYFFLVSKMNKDTHRSFTRRIGREKISWFEPSAN